ncbi:MBL fold metallo-hydrolase [Yinghuangia seranimata]|uniref:MBL fold metallo-hydrolase n=1 Tax=Yinghuangia seranimata TaxID=408067 RepID=UPI00248CD665|nr:MBL fold metallo-hydrolase [Yinghuangia seranimata]MDI2129107.1 MBL fold metallo-hydrolase [Yinghuangia seranimata]
MSANARLTVHTHTAGEAGLFVNAYLVETADGVVVIDTSLLNTDIAELAARVAAVGKPLLGVFVTHAHPDHFNGAHALVAAHGAPVYATTAVAKTIRDIADAKRAQWGPVYGDEWPAETAYPTVELADGDTVVLGGVTFTAREVGPAESHADSYLLAQAGDGRPVAFIGDLAFHHVHSYTADGHSTRWLEALDTLTRELADAAVLYPGHGAPGGVELFAAQRQYLLFYREAVRGIAAGAPALDDAGKERLDRAVRAYLPDAPLTWMIGLGADAVAAELAATAATAETEETVGTAGATAPAAPVGGPDTP